MKRNFFLTLTCASMLLPIAAQSQPLASSVSTTATPSLSSATSVNQTSIASSGRFAEPVKAAESGAITVKLTGFVRNDFSYDTRQTVNLREASVDLYPKDKQLDVNGQDINAVTNFNMLAINSRLGVAFTGPDAFGAKTSGLLEMEWFGPSDAAVGGVRLRHAWAKLDWPKRQLAFGQFWHPLFVTEVFPGVVNFNTGIPFQPFNRSPQIRLTEHLGKDVHLILAAIAQRDFTSIGVNAGSSEYMRNSAVPNLHAQLQVKKERVVAGLAFDYKLLRPRLSTGSGTTLLVSDATVGSTALMAYLKVVGRATTFKVEAVKGSNMTDHVMLGGFLAYGTPAVGTTPAVEMSYKPTGITSVWAELVGNGKTVVPAIFVGYCTNTGNDPNAIAAYGRGIGIGGRGGISDLFRVSPRLEVISGKFRLGTELELTKAGIGTSTTDGKVISADQITNTRLLFTTTYSF
ncbi:hypothetical protein GO730_31025 [Spirosoma sp. HMF3257]|uniref:Porin n=1 Tax=Spirosoma telluris TaxID=2183553 RepID=A0A327NQE7_9BACT|nr:hypothetical protein [Spirosoma telluris]RAI77492.1 hypothetical protein HMF3257_30930 [Spirosoma telluris]